VAGGRPLEAVQLLSRMADESAGSAGDRGLAGEPGPGAGPVPADSHLLRVRVPRHQPVRRPARRDPDRGTNFPLQWLSGPGCGHSSPEVNGGLTMTPVVRRREMKVGHRRAPLSFPAGWTGLLNRAGPGEPIAACRAKPVIRANRVKWAPGSLIPVADTYSTRPSCASYFVVQGGCGRNRPRLDVQLPGGSEFWHPGSKCRRSRGCRLAGHLPCSQCPLRKVAVANDSRL
jgi:hypothetical protein